MPFGTRRRRPQHGPRRKGKGVHRPSNTGDDTDLVVVLVNDPARVIGNTLPMGHTVSEQQPPQSVEAFDEIGPGAHAIPKPCHRPQSVAVPVQGRNGQSTPEPVIDVEVELLLRVGQHTRTPEVIDRDEDPYLDTHTPDIVRVHPEETRHMRDIPRARRQHHPRGRPGEARRYRCSTPWRDTGRRGVGKGHRAGDTAQTRTSRPRPWTGSGRPSGRYRPRASSPSTPGSGPRPHWNRKGQRTPESSEHRGDRHPGQGTGPLLARGPVDGHPALRGHPF